MSHHLGYLLIVTIPWVIWEGYPFIPCDLACYLGQDQADVVLRDIQPDRSPHILRQR